MHLSAEVATTIVYVQNRLSCSGLELETHEEMYTEKKPRVRHLKIFGCPLYVHILKEKRTKLYPSSKKRIFVGYCEFSKPLRIYILGFHHIDISRNVTFNEEVDLKKSRRCQLEEVHEEDVPPKKVEVEPSPKIVAFEVHDMPEP